MSYFIGNLQYLLEKDTRETALFYFEDYLKNTSTSQKLELTRLKSVCQDERIKQVIIVENKVECDGFVISVLFKSNNKLYKLAKGRIVESDFTVADVVQSGLYTTAEEVVMIENDYVSSDGKDLTGAFVIEWIGELITAKESPETLLKLNVTLYNRVEAYLETIWKDNQQGEKLAEMYSKHYNHCDPKTGLPNKSTNCLICSQSRYTAPIEQLPEETAGVNNANLLFNEDTREEWELFDIVPVDIDETEEEEESALAQNYQETFITETEEEGEVEKKCTKRSPFPFLLLSPKLLKIFQKRKRNAGDGNKKAPKKQRKEKVNKTKRANTKKQKQSKPNMKITKKTNN